MLGGLPRNVDVARAYRYSSLLPFSCRHLTATPCCSSFVGVSPAAFGEMPPQVEMWSKFQPTGLRMRDLCRAPRQNENLLQQSVFLHRELRIRLARCVVDLLSMPAGSFTRLGFRDVIQAYTASIMDLEEFPCPTNPWHCDAFHSLLGNVCERETAVVHAVMAGTRDVMRDLGEGYETIRPQMDACLTRFLTDHIALRFLLRQSLASHAKSAPGFSGVLQFECSPAEVARAAAADGVALSKAHLGVAPQIIIRERTSETLPYVPQVLQYILTELFKNSCRAVVERHTYGFDDGSGDELPPVRCYVDREGDAIVVQVADDGCGIRAENMDKVWAYTYTTSQSSAWSAAVDSLRAPVNGRLAGFGVGLALSRVYARYFGGDLVISSAVGVGTKACVHLNRLIDDDRLLENMAP
jgi:pyruvate dehydrogenase kinase 2/3/4